MAAPPKRAHGERSGYQGEEPAVKSARRLFQLLLALGALAATAAVFAPASVAAGSCPARTVTQPFARFGDSNGYFLVPGGSFESGAPGWSLSYAWLVQGNESYYLGSLLDRKSLWIGSSATSAGFCITQSDPLARFAAKSVRTGSGGNYSQLNMYAVVSNSAGSQATYWLGALQAGSYANWTVTPQIQYGSLFDSWLFQANGTGTLKFLFTVQGQGGAWYVDDLYVDPFMGR
jgi:hypothetical protein